MKMLLTFALLAIAATGLIACGEDKTEIQSGDKKLSVSH